MSVDRQLKRLFPLVVCALVAVAAYFQASGIGQLVAATIGSTPPVKPAVVSFAAPKAAPKSAKPILARNAFDSETGPLDGSALPVPTASPTAKDDTAEPSEQSEDAPKCDFGSVVMISASDDPDWSFAAIRDQQGRTQLRRKGDQVSGHELRSMSYNRVWLDNSGKECQMKLGDKAAVAAAKPKPKRRRRRRRRSRGISPKMAAKIHKIGPTEFNVERSVVDEILQNQAQLMRSARIVPEKKGDKVVGIRLFGIRDGSLLHHLGIRSGDRLEAINGFEMTDPQKALEAYGRLRTASNLKVRVNRKGRPTVIEFNIQ